MRVVVWLMIGLIASPVFTGRTFADAEPTPRVENLPTSPAWATGDACLSVRDATARADGAAVQLSAWSIGASLDAALKQIPQALRKRVELCPWTRAGTPMGWFAAPVGWHERDAVFGATPGGAWTFVAAGGPRGGWLMITKPGTGPSILSYADGLFAGAHQQHNTFLRSIGASPAPRVTLSPRTAMLSHPDHCTALLTYHRGGFTVRGQVYYGDQQYDAGDRNLLAVYAGMPPDQTMLRKLMFASFWGGKPPRNRRCMEMPLPARLPDGDSKSKAPADHAAGTFKARNTTAREPADANVRRLPWSQPTDVVTDSSANPALPAGWRIHHQRTSGIGAPSGMAYVAPGGADRGWMIVAHEWLDSADTSLDADALLPFAYAIATGVSRPVTSGVRLLPVPESLTHPNRCTALLTYHSGALVVKAIAHLTLAPDNDRLTELFVAMPPQDATQQARILRSIKAQHPGWFHACLADNR